MKRKLPKVLAALAVMSFGYQAAFADTDKLKPEDGWQKISAMPADNELDNYYYVLVDQNTDLAIGVPRDAFNARPQYLTVQNPFDNHKNLVWSVVKNTAGGYALQVLSDGMTYVFLNKDGGEWDMLANTNITDKNHRNTNVIIEPEGSTFLLKNHDAFYIGPWHPGQFNNEEDLAGNKSLTDAGRFYIYRIAKTDYNNRTTEENLNLLANADFAADKTSWNTSNNVVKQTNAEMSGTYLERYEPTSECYVAQTLTGLKAGTYTFSAHVVSRNLDSKLYASVNGTEVARQPINHGDDVHKNKESITFDVPAGATVVVGYICRTPSTTGGRWFAIDQCELKRTGDTWYTVGGVNDLHRNTWSTEGTNDGSGMLTPFFEDWVAGSQNKPLNNKKITHESVKALQAGVYLVKAKIRAYKEYQVTAGEKLTGINLFAGNKQVSAINGTDCALGGKTGVYGDYAVAVDLAAGKDLVYGIDINGANVNWVSFDESVTYERIGDAVTAETPAWQNAIAEAEQAISDASGIKGVELLAAYTALSDAKNAAPSVDALNTLMETTKTFKRAIKSRGALTLNETDGTNPTAQGVYNVTVNRPLKQGYWNPICLPFAISKNYFAHVRELTGVTESGNGNVQLNFTEPTGEVLEAGKPYIVLPAADQATIEQNDVVLSTTAQEVMQAAGSTTVKMKGIYAKQGLVANDYYLSTSNSFKYLTAPKEMKGYRAYWTIESSNGVRPEAFLSVDDVTTSVAPLLLDEEGNAPLYDLSGRRINKPAKGLYILNGKKYLVK